LSTVIVNCLPRRPTPVIACPSIDCSGGSKVFSTLMPGVRTDSMT
jgi:hypothetical protein